MSETNPNTEVNFNNFPEEIPSGIKVLTILTFIGSGIAIVFTLITPWIIKFSLSMMDKAMASGQELSTKQLDDMEKARKAMDLLHANLVPVITVGIIGAILCIIGAVMMRKLKKDGFWIYIGGELLPLIAGLILMGTAQFTGVFSVIVGVGVPVLFVVLYGLQLKYMKK
jgi:hypothetical protein